MGLLMLSCSVWLLIPLLSASRSSHPFCCFLTPYPHLECVIFIGKMIHHGERVREGERERDAVSSVLDHSWRDSAESNITAWGGGGKRQERDGKK